MQMQKIRKGPEYVELSPGRMKNFARFGRAVERRVPLVKILCNELEIRQLKLLCHAKREKYKIQFHQFGGIIAG